MPMKMKPGNFRFFVGRRPLPAAVVVVVGLVVAMVGNGKQAALGEPCRPEPQMAKRELRRLPTRTFEYEQDWALSSNDELFGVLKSVQQAPQGNLIVHDQQLGHVLVLSKTGTVKLNYSALGDGPGKVVFLSQVFPGPGGTIGLLQSWPDRIEILDAEGVPKTTLHLHPVAADDAVDQLMLMHVSTYQGRYFGVLARIQDLGAGKSWNRLSMAALGPDLDLSVTEETHCRIFHIASRPAEIDETAGYYPFDKWVVIPGGKFVYPGRRDQYSLVVAAPDSTAGTEFIRSDLGTMNRSPAEIEAFTSQFKATQNGKDVRIRFHLFPTAEMIHRLVALDGSTVAITGAFLGPAGNGHLYDMVDLSHGTYREIHSNIRWNPDCDDMFVLETGNVVVVENGRAHLHAADDAGCTDVPVLRYWRVTGGDR